MASFRPEPRELPPDLEADRLACLLKTALQRISVPLTRAAAVLMEQQTWNDLGYARLEDHARERYGRSGRWVRDLAALGRGLDRLPGLEEALSGADGKAAIGFVPALYIARIASPESVPAWLGLARTMSVRRLKERIRLARQAGSSWPVEAVGGEQPETESGTSPGNDPSRHKDVNAPPGGQATGPRAGHLDTDDEAAGEWLRVRLLVPRPIRSAFDEGLELCRAVEGHDVPVSVYVDALVAEASTGESPADANCLPVLHGKTHAAREEALELATASWRELGDAPSPDHASEHEDPEMARMSGLLQRILQCSSQGGATPPNVLHAGLGGPDETSRHAAGGNSGPKNILHRTVEEPDEASRAIPGRNGSPPNVFHATIEDPDAVIRQLLVLQDRCERQLGRLLARMSDQGTWRRLQFAGLGHYAEQRLGLARTSARERSRLARGLRTLPVIRQAYDDGRLGSVAALYLVRMLEKEPPDEAVQKEWVARAARATVKRLRDEHRELDRRRANERSPRACRPLTDAEWHRSLHREPGTARARVARLGRDATVLSFANTIFSVSLPEDLAATFLSAIESARKSLQDRVRAARVAFDEPGEQAPALYPGRLIPSGDGESDNRAHALCAEQPNPAGDEEPNERDSALCPDQLINSGKGEPGKWVRTLCMGRLTPSGTGAAGEKEGSDGDSDKEDLGEDKFTEHPSGHDEPGGNESHRSETDVRPSLNIARKLVAHGHEVPSWVGLLALIEEFVVTWDVAQNPRRPSEDAVHIRDGWRCMAPGCTSRRNLQEHHVRYRSQGGGDEMDNRLCLCAFHHQRGEHGGLASCRGRAPLGIEWSLGRGGRGGLFRNEMRVTGHETDRLSFGRDHAPVP